MKSNLNSASVWMRTALMITGVLAMTSCGLSGEGNTTMISLEKDGTVRSHIEESFDQSYYDKEELQQMILMETADYNREAGSGCISVEKVELKDQIATVEMTYQKAEDYAGFNRVVFFDGTPKEAEDAGYELNVVLSSVKDSLDTIGKADILAMGDYRLLITDVGETVVLNGKAAYVSENVTVSDNGKCVKNAEDSEDSAYILYK